MKNNHIVLPTMLKLSTFVLIVIGFVGLFSTRAFAWSSWGYEIDGVSRISSNFMPHSSYRYDNLMAESESKGMSIADDRQGFGSRSLHPDIRSDQNRMRNRSPWENGTKTMKNRESWGSKPVPEMDREGRSH